MAGGCSHLDTLAHPPLPAERRALAAPAHVHRVRAHRLLRFLAQPPCHRARQPDRPPGDPLGGAGRGLVLVLSGRAGIRAAGAVSWSIGWYEGPRPALCELFLLADDSVAQV